MITSIFIILVCSTLFVYWFRYMCLLILSDAHEGAHVNQVARANRLSFLDVRDSLSGSCSSPELGEFHGNLMQDYALITYLLRHGSAQSAPVDSLEQQLLRIDFKLMTLWFAATRRFSSSHASVALREMTSILSYLANQMGERFAVSSRA